MEILLSKSNIKPQDIIVDYTFVDVNSDVVEDNIIEIDENGDEVTRIEYSFTTKRYSINEFYNAAEIEIDEHKKWLMNHDYIKIKHDLGEYDDNSPKYIEWLTERRTRVDRINELEKLISLKQGNAKQITRGE